MMYKRTLTITVDGLHVRANGPNGVRVDMRAHSQQDAEHTVIAAMRVAARASAYDPTADHEGEQTRAIDGAGVVLVDDQERRRADAELGEAYARDPFGYLTSLHDAVDGPTTFTMPSEDGGPPLEVTLQEPLKFVAVFTYHVTVHSFLASVALDAVKFGHVKRYDIAPNVWTQLARETCFGSAPGTRCSGDVFEVFTCTGWVPVHCNAILDDHTGTASLDAGESTRQAHLDFSSVVIA